MAIKKKTVEIEIVGNDKKFRSSMGEVSGIAKTTAIAVTAAFTAASAATIKAVNSFRQFEKQFTTVTTLLDSTNFKTKTLTEGINDLQKGVINLRKTSGESFDNLNRGLFDLISAGVDAEKAISALDTATKLARAGATSTSIAVDGLTSVLNAYSFDASEAQAVSEKFFTAQKFGKTTIEELSRGFGQVGTTAKTMGVSLEELLATISSVTLGGVETSQAYTGLAAIFANIIRPTKEASDEAKRLGISFNSTALRAQGLDGFLKSIINSSNFSATSLEKLFSSTEATKTIIALTNNDAEKFTEILSELGNKSKAAATFTEALNKQAKTLDQSMNEASGALDAVFVSIGEKLAPKVSDLTDRFKTLLDNITDDDIEAIATGFATIAEAVVSVGQALAFVVKQYGRLAQFNELVGRGLADIFSPSGDGVGGEVARLKQELAEMEELGLSRSADGRSREEIQTNINILSGRRPSGADATSSDEIGALLGQDPQMSFPSDSITNIEGAAGGGVVLGDKEPAPAKVSGKVIVGDKEIEGGSAAVDDVALLGQVLPANLRTEEQQEAYLEALRQQKDSELTVEQKHYKRLIEEDQRFRQQMQGNLSGFLLKRFASQNTSNEQILQMTQEFNGAMATLSRSGNKELAAISKAYRVAESIWATYTAANNALAQLPFPFNVAVAGVLTAAGLANVQQITSTKVQGAAQGGIVGGFDTGRDNQMMAVRSGEMIVPPDMVQALTPTLRDLVRNEDTRGVQDTGSQSIKVEFVGDAGRVLRAIERENQQAGFIV